MYAPFCGTIAHMVQEVEMSKKKTITSAVVVALMLFLVACSGSVVSELYIRDLLDVGENPTAVYYTTATIEMESPGEDSLKQLTEKMQEWFREAQNFRQVERDFSSYLVADIKVPVSNSSMRVFDAKGDLISLIVQENAQGDIDFGFRFDREVFEQISSYVKEEFWTTLSIQDWEFSIILKNDTRESQRVILQTIYANQQPVLFPEEFMLLARDSITLNFADVLRDYAYKEGEVLFGTLIRE